MRIAMIFRSGFFFLSPRRRSGERTEERGNPKRSQPTCLLSPTLSSIRWRRGSFFGCGWAALRCIADFQFAALANIQHFADWKSATQQVGNLRYETVRVLVD